MSMTGPDGERTVTATDFFEGVMMTVLGEHEVLTAISLPTAPPGQGSAYVKFSHPASRYAVIGVAASVTISDGVCSAASVVVGGLVPTPVQASSVEQALVGNPLTADTGAAAAQAVGDDLGSDDDLLGDIFASATYRKAVAPVWVRRAIAAAVERAG